MKLNLKLDINEDGDQCVYVLWQNDCIIDIYSDYDEACNGLSELEHGWIDDYIVKSKYIAE